MSDGHRRIDLQRTGSHTYRATSASGASLEFGQREGLLTPVELLLAALGGCASIDVDEVTGRRAEPTVFDVIVEGEKAKDDEHGAHMRDLRVTFDVQFPDTPEGRQAAGMVARLVQLSHDKDCTVSRTIELPTPVEMRSLD